MKKQLFALAASCAAIFGADAQSQAVFDFSKPTTLVPEVIEPAQKQGISLDRSSFTCGDVEIAFVASATGNTHVRIYHSYDAGIDLRLYDGDAMTVSSLNPELTISSIKFTMSLSGAASGANDINFIPSTGDFDWAAETWTPDEGDQPRSVVLTSAEQSRIYTVTVTLAEKTQTSAAEIEAVSIPAEYYTLLGRKLSGSPVHPGVYIRRHGSVTERVLIR